MFHCTALNILFSSAKVTRGWKLLKNISRLGFHRNNTADDESLSLVIFKMILIVDMDH